MKQFLLSFLIILSFGATRTWAQVSGTSPVLWPGFFPVISDLRDATNNRAEDVDLYQQGDALNGQENGFSFQPVEDAKPLLRVFPNPTTEYFEVSNPDRIDRIYLYSMTGRQVRTYTAWNGQRYYVGDLPDGMYLASLINDEEGVVKTLRLLKRSLRP